MLFCSPLPRHSPMLIIYSDCLNSRWTPITHECEVVFRASTHIVRPILNERWLSEVCRHHKIHAIYCICVNCVRFVGKIEMTLEHIFGAHVVIVCSLYRVGVYVCITRHYVAVCLLIRSIEIERSRSWVNSDAIVEYAIVCQGVLVCSCVLKKTNRIMTTTY